MDLASGLTFPEKASVHRLCECDHSVYSVHFSPQITVISPVKALGRLPEHRGLAFDGILERSECTYWFRVLTPHLL